MKEKTRNKRRISSLNYIIDTPQRATLYNLLAQKMYWADESALRAYLFREDGFQKHISILKKILGDLKGKLILDIGCGTGGLSLALRFEGAKVCGVDIFRGIEREDATISRVRASCYNLTLTLCQANAEVLPFKANIFDAVVSIGMIEHILEKNARINVFNEAMRVLKSDGIFFVTAHPNRYVPYDIHFGFLPFVNWLPKFLRKPYVSLFKPIYIGTVEDTKNVSTQEFKQYLRGMSTDIINVYPQMALPAGSNRQGKNKTFLSWISLIFTSMQIKSIVYWIARLMVWTSTEIVVSLVARKRMEKTKS